MYASKSRFACFYICSSFHLLKALPRAFYLSSYYHGKIKIFPERARGKPCKLYIFLLLSVKKLLPGYVPQAIQFSRQVFPWQTRPDNGCARILEYGFGG